MMNFLKKIFVETPKFDSLIEGMYAHQYLEEEAGGPRAEIRHNYRLRWPEPNLHKTPVTHPWLFDPCDPPKGWAYDPYYETWINVE